MIALITGSAGFYGKHLSDELEENGYEVIRCDLKAEGDIISMDVMNSDMVLDIISQHRPDVLVNMAGQANVGLSWKKPQLTVHLNTIGLINILEAVKTVNPKMRVIAIGSSDEYGNLKQHRIISTYKQNHPAKC
ncbi:MAG: GDP-mannose 4,6-dehydratase [Clostridiales bacterium]|nr:GDP-mannose 4,6-dehydratase [Clostridiales bacterium]